MQNIVIIGTIGFAILLIACFNFINLAIALNFRRYREAGIKKVAGSGKSDHCPSVPGRNIHYYADKPFKRDHSGQGASDRFQYDV